jgi:hypothetical protein
MAGLGVAGQGKGANGASIHTKESHVFEAKEEIAEMVNRLFAMARPLKRGEVIGHDAIREILGVEPHSGHWQHCMGKFRRRMEQERHISVWPVHTVGYKLCTVAEQLELPHIRMVRARRHIKRGMRSLDALPKSGLTLHQQKVRAAQSANLRKSHRELTSQIHQKVPIQRPAEVLPKARVEASSSLAS